MKICTITCHDVYNYGASLQAYALQHYLQNQGHEVEIIDYKPEYQNHYFKFWYVPPYYEKLYRLSRKNVFLHFICAIRLIPLNFGTIGRKRPFDRFTKEFLHITRRYSSYQELACNPPEAVLYIAGSDQIWNCKMENGKDPSFFLQFGENDIKRISYAASFATPEMPEENKQQVKSFLSSFDRISVRERSGVDIVEKLGFKAENVLDPVFLLSRDEWISITDKKRPCKDKYLLVYNLSRSTKGLDDAVRKIAQENKYKIVAIDAYRRYPFADISIHNAGPREFVNLIANAEYVIADSFHAMAFSLIFNKSFAVYYCYNNISRMSDLLNILGLADCLNPIVPRTSICWSDVNGRISTLKETSINFLCDSICDGFIN